MHEVELELGVLVFVEGGKPEYPEKNPRSKDENQQQTQPTYERRVRESNPGHIGGRRALSPLHHPCFPLSVKLSDSDVTLHYLFQVKPKKARHLYFLFAPTPSIFSKKFFVGLEEYKSFLTSQSCLLSFGQFLKSRRNS